VLTVAILSSDLADEDVVDATPTKDFFIDMLVRDIDLIPAIVDLVDNCVDGARRMRPDGDYTDLYVLLDVGPEKFQISDNCGGIPVDLARHYAFRFGRPPDMPSTPRAIGQFGIGMKRALFKLGTAFEIVSTTTKDHFVLKDDVASWRARDEWAFRFDSRTAKKSAANKTGTTVTVTALHDEVKEQFNRGTFVTELAADLRRVHQSSMDAGLAITLNAIPLDVERLQLLQSESLKPAFEDLVFYANDPPQVHVRLYAGLGVSNPNEAGWYVYCNGRLVLGADQTNTTGWGEGRGNPRFHNQYARFRGYAFFESADVAKLPWTTTKTGVDPGTPIYRNVRQRMVNLMRPVISFLNDLDREKEAPPRDKTSLEEVVSSAEKTPIVLSAVQPSKRFEAPLREPRPVAPASQSIQYRRPKAQIEKAKRKLRVTSASQVGEHCSGRVIRPGDGQVPRIKGAAAYVGALHRPDRRSHSCLGNIRTAPVAQDDRGRPRRRTADTATPPSPLSEPENRKWGSSAVKMINRYDPR
jgi:hypothetical protein